MKGRANRWLVYGSTKDSARTRVALRKLGDFGVDAGFDRIIDAELYTRDDAADLSRRLEVWVGAFPDELREYHPDNELRRADLLGLMIAATERRAVLLTEVGHTGNPRLQRDGLMTDLGWEDDLLKVVLFDQIALADWNMEVCPRCGNDATVTTEEGLHWCKRHAKVRAWEPIEVGEGKTWQSMRLDVMT